MTPLTVEIIAGAVGIIVVNLLAWAFLWGSWKGRVNTRLKAFEEKGIRSECAEIFTEIRERLSSVTGKVDVILLMMKENQKNEEKRKIQNRG